jgi:hypothetical protein
MKVRKVVTGSVLAIGVGAAGLLGAGTAFAGPGISYSSNGSDAVGFGDQNAGTGAFANSGTEGKNNQALAISTGFSPVGATAIATGEGNNVVAIDGVGVTGPLTKRNNVVTAFGGTLLGGDAHDNNVLNVGGIVSQQALQGNAAGVTNISVCGTTLTGEAKHLTVDGSPLCGGDSK